MGLGLSFHSQPSCGEEVAWPSHTGSWEGAEGTEERLGLGACRPWARGGAQALAGLAPFPHSGGSSALLAKL